MTEEKKEKESNEHILRHRYNPEFKILSKDDVDELLAKFDVKLIDLPKISVNDPICKIFKAQVNDVLKITRKSYTAGESVFFRVVVNG